MAIEAQVKYWVVAQKHPDLRDHFRHLADHAHRTAAESRDRHDPLTRLRNEHLALKQHCANLRELVRTYAQVVNELALENTALRETVGSPTTVTPFKAPHES
ncbi:hypothetical protein ACWGR4_28910 [Embleya sp. NPDC055664]